jgi:hypothetical protein
MSEGIFGFWLWNANDDASLVVSDQWQQPGVYSKQDLN